MKRCPNCDRETLRTKDWACPWCAYPLVSESYKEMPLTYKEWKQGKPDQTKSVPESETEQPKSPVEPEPAPKAVPELKVTPEVKKEPEPQEEPIALPKVVEPIPEPEPEVPKLKVIPEVKKEPEPQEEPIALPKVVEPIPEPEPEVPAIILTADELLEAYTTDDTEADTKYVNKLLRVTGVLLMKDIKDILETHYIRLVGSKEKTIQNVKCMFDKKHALDLNKLQKGQTVTVQGVFNGSIMAIRMIDCVLV